MIRDRKDYPKVLTPRGAAIWPALNQPDFKFKKEFGEYHVRLRLEPDAPGLAKIIEDAEALRDEAFEAKKAELERQKKGALLKQLYKIDPIKPEVDSETGEETGFLVLRASMNAGGKRQKDGSVWKARPDIFNAAGNPLKNPPTIGSGSEMKLNVTPMDYETDGGKGIGVRFELNAAQLLKAVSYGQRNADDYGFGSEDDADLIEDQEPNTHGFADEGDADADGVPGDF